MVAYPRVLSLCSGIGLLDRAVHGVLPGARTLMYVEREAFAVATLVKAMEEGALAEAAIWSDLATVPTGPLRGCIDMVVAGLPCQPFSLAGKGLGSEDHRHLWPLARRIIDDVQPALVFLENVPGQLSRGFEAIAEELQGLGYRCRRRRCRSRASSGRPRMG